MDFVTLSMPCPTCGRGPAPGAIRNSSGKWQKCPTCGGESTVEIPCRRQSYDYAWPVISLGGTSGDVIDTELQLEDDSFFELDAWTCVADGPTRKPQIQVLDRSSGWNFSNAPIDYQNFFGGHGNLDMSNGYSPAALLVKFIFRPTDVIAMLVTSDGSDGTIQPVMKGYKLYPLDSSMLSEGAGAASSSAQGASR